jgi:non-ribosomal peptide synthetase component F
VQHDDPTILSDFFVQAAMRSPTRIALQFDDLAITYAQLLHLSQYLAYHIHSIGVNHLRDTVIPICVDKSIEMVVAMFGVLLSGFGYVNIEPATPSARKAMIVGGLRDHGQINMLAIVQQSEMSVWNAIEYENPMLSDVKLLDPSAILRPLIDELNRDPACDLLKRFPLPSIAIPRPSSNGLAYVVFTSGSTGAPKGIMVQHRNVVAFLNNYLGVFGRSTSEDQEVERVLQFPSYSFDVIVVNILDTLRGSTLCMTSAANLFSDLAGTVLRFNCTLVDLTPTVSTLLWDHEEAQPVGTETVKDAWIRAGFKIKSLATGGEKVEKWVLDGWIQRGVKVVIDYGPSETTVGVISNQRTHLPSDIVPIGRATGNNVILLLSESLELVAEGEEGEICVAGDQVTAGYVNAELNEGVFVEHEIFGRIYRTGDIARMVKGGGGDIEYLGRRDGQVKLNGLR